MKIIEALKKVQDLRRKTDDLAIKIATHCAHMNYETPVYTDQKKKVEEWLQSYSDILKEILNLRVSIQKTNLEVEVTIEIGGKSVTKSIAAWIHRRRDLAKLECDIWKRLGDRGLKEGVVTESTGTKKDLKIIRYFDPEKRDLKIDLFSSEPSLIDARLEIINAVTDLILV